VYDPEKGVLQYLDHPDAEFRHLGSCFQSITVRSFLAKGAYGAVYDVSYKETDCIMKIVVNKRVIERTHATSKTLQRATSEASFEREVRRLRKASDLNIGPRFYYAAKCAVQLPYFFGEETIHIGVIVLERLLCTLAEFVDTAISQILRQKTYERIRDELILLRKTLMSFQRTIEKDCERAAAHDVFIDDIHLNNIMIRVRTRQQQELLRPLISDWGVTAKRAQCARIPILKHVYYRLQESKLSSKAVIDLVDSLFSPPRLAFGPK
jgi:hypothetical protein